MSNLVELFKLTRIDSLLNLIYLFFESNELLKLNFVLLIFIIFVLWYTYKWLNVTEIIGDLGDKKCIHNHSNLKNQNKSEELPPFYPNGWIPVLESIDLKRNQIKPVFAFGYDLVVFRGSSGVVHIADTYCPHLGANIGVGGEVVGDSVRCPFHGWTFDCEGTCINAPGVDSQNLPRAKLKIWNSLEVNGFIFVWHHSEGKSPKWYQEQIKKLVSSKLHYRGRAQHIVNCKLQEIPENGADIMHFNELHSAPEFLGTLINRSRLFNIVSKYLKYTWSANWEPCPPPKEHTSQMIIKSDYSLFGYKFMKVALNIQQIGPAFVLLDLTINCLGQIDCIILQAITPIGPRENQVVHHFYTQSNLKALLFSKFIIHGEARMFERDIVIWNNKIFLSRPHFAKNEESLLKFRRWFKQFYDI